MASDHARTRRKSDRRTTAQHAPKGSAYWSERFPASYLRQRFSYDPETGELRWRDHESMAPALRARLKGKPALTARLSGGYRGGMLDGVQVKAHRIAYVIATGAWPADGFVLEPRSEDKADLRLENWRLVPKGSNARRTAPRATGHLGVVGVSFKSGAFQARIGTNSDLVHLGSFERIEDAVAARFEAERQRGYEQRETLAERQRAAAAALAQSVDLDGLKDAERVMRKASRERVKARSRADFDRALPPGFRRGRDAG